MSTDKIYCPDCKTALSLPPNRHGMIKCQCPKCSAVLEITVPAPVTQIGAEKPKKTGVQPPAPPAEEPSAPAPDTPQGGTQSRKTPTRPKPKPRKVSGEADDPAAPPKAWTRWLTIACLGLVLVLCVVGAGVGVFIGVENLDADRVPAKTETPDKIASGGAKKTAADKKDPAPPQPNAKPPAVSKKDNTLVPFDAVASRDRLKRILAVQIKGKVQSFDWPNVRDVTITWGAMKRLKYEQTGAMPTSLVLLKDHGWQLKDGKAAALAGKALAESQNAHYAMILSNLLPLLEPGFDIVSGDEKTVNGTPCECSIVKRNGRPPVSMCFNKATDRLVMAEMDGESLGLAPKTQVAFHYLDYRKVDGIEHWHKQEQWRNGKLYDALTVSEIHFLDKVDDAIYAVPGLEDQVQNVLASYQLGEKREMVRQALSRLPPSTEPEFTRLVKGLSHKDAGVRMQARQAIFAYADLWGKNQVAQFERSGISSLVVLLKTGDDNELQAFGVEALMQLGPQAAEAIPEVIKIARDSRDAKVLTGALRVLKSAGAKTNDVLSVYEKNLDHPDASVKDAAARALLAIGPGRLPIACVIDLIARPELEIRSAARKLLEQKSPALTSKDLPVLRQGLKSPVPEVRRAVMDALGSLKFDAKEAVPDLIPLIGAEDKGVSAQAIDTLEKMGRLADAVSASTDPAVLMPALAALKAKKIKTPEALAAYEKQLDHPDAPVREAAALLLLDLEPGRLQVDRLVEFAASSNEEIKTVGSTRLRKKLAAVTVKDLPYLRNGLKNPAPEIRITFVEAIASLKADGKDAAADLGDLLGKADKDIAVPIMRALEGMGKGGAKAVPALEKKVEGADKDLAVAAAQALCRIEPGNGVLKDVGIDMLLQDLNPDITKIKALIARPLASRSASALVALGEPAVPPLVKQLLIQKEAKKVPQNEQVSAVASRFLGYQLLKELGKKAKDNDDKKLAAALKKYESALKARWSPQEEGLAKQTKALSALPPEVRQLYAEASDAAYQAYRAVSALR